MNPLREVLILSLVLPAAALAKDKCFCLVDDNDNIRHGCFTQQKGYKTETRCLDQDGKEFIVTHLEDWTKIPDDKGRCDPCKQPLNVKEGPIRGYQKGHPSQATSNDRTE
jgi:hypothetical protein